eukprot:205846_1
MGAVESSLKPPASCVSDQSLNTNNKYASSHADNMKILNALVVLVCVGKYDGKGKKKLPNLKGTKTDALNMTKLFKESFNYNVLQNSNERCTLDDLKRLLSDAVIEFNSGDYQSIIVIYSGHGDKDTLILSDYYGVKEYRSTKSYLYNKMNIDACRGTEHATGIVFDEKHDNDAVTDTLVAKGPQIQPSSKKSHPNENRIIFYPNTEPFSAYDDANKGARMLNALYDTLMDERNKNKNLSQIQGIMMDKMENKSISVKLDDEQQSEYYAKIEVKTTMKISALQQIYFQKNTGKIKSIVHQDAVVEEEKKYDTEVVGHTKINNEFILKLAYTCTFLIHKEFYQNELGLNSPKAFASLFMLAEVIHIYMLKLHQNQGFNENLRLFIKEQSWLNRAFQSKLVDFEFAMNVSEKIEKYVHLNQKVIDDINTILSPNVNTKGSEILSIDNVSTKKLEAHHQKILKIFYWKFVLLAENAQKKLTNIDASLPFEFEYIVTALQIWMFRNNAIQLEAI